MPVLVYTMIYYLTDITDASMCKQHFTDEVELILTILYTVEFFLSNKHSGIKSTIFPSEL